MEFLGCMRIETELRSKFKVMLSSYLSHDTDGRSCDSNNLAKYCKYMLKFLPIIFPRPPSFLKVFDDYFISFNII